MQASQLDGQGKAETGAGVLAVRRALDPAEARPRRRDIVLGNADTGIGDLDPQGAVVLKRAGNADRAAGRRELDAVREDVDHRTQVSFPIIGAMDDAKFQREYVFVPLVESPGIAFITVSQDTSSTSTISAIVQYLPLYLFCLTMAYAAGIIVWGLVSIFSHRLK